MVGHNRCPRHTFPNQIKLMNIEEQKNLVLDYKIVGGLGTFIFNGEYKDIVEESGWQQNYIDSKPCRTTLCHFYALEYQEYATDDAKEQLQNILHTLKRRQNMSAYSRITNNGTVLWDHQTSLIQTISRNKFCLCDDPPRSGKTLTACTLIDINNFRYSIIVAPANASKKEQHWHEQLSKYTNKVVYVASKIKETREFILEILQGQITGGSYIFVMSPNIFRHHTISRYLSLLPINFICIDEIDQAFSNVKNKSYKALAKIIKNTYCNKTKGENTLEMFVGYSGTLYNTAKPTRLRAYLSMATLFRKHIRMPDSSVNSLLLHFGLVEEEEEMLSPRAIGRFLRFLFVVSRTGFSRDIGKNFDLTIYTPPGVDKQNIVEKCKDFVDMAEKSDRVITKEIIATFHENATEKRAKIIAKKVLRLVQQGEKVIVVAYHKTMIKSLEVMLNVRGYDGSTPQAVRTELVHQFQNDPYQKIFLAQILSCCQNLRLDKATKTFFGELYWTPDKIIQMMNRQRFFLDKHKKEVIFMVGSAIDQFMMGQINQNYEGAKALMIS